MSDIFGGVEPPRWLQSIARPADMSVASKDIGMVLGGGLNALKQDPNAPKADPQTGEQPSWLSTRRGFTEGLQEARLSQQDPLWQLRTEQAKSGLLGNIIHNEQAFQTLKVGNEERQNWLKALPGMTKWLTARPEDRANMEMPDPMGSTQAISIMDKIRQSDESYFLRRQQNDIRIANSKAVLDDQRRKQSWGDALGAVSPEARSRIAALSQSGLRVDADGWYVDSNGRPTQPSVEALQILNEARSQSGLPRWGATKAEIDKYKADQIRAAADAKNKTAAEKVDETKRHNLVMEGKGGAGTEPQLKKLPNGQTAIWVPGSKGIHILRDPKQEMNSKVAFENYKAANAALKKAQEIPGKPERLKPYQDRVDAALKQLDGLFQYSPDAATTNSPSASSPSNKGVMTTPGGLTVRIISQ